MTEKLNKMKIEEQTSQTALSEDENSMAELRQALLKYLDEMDGHRIDNSGSNGFSLCDEKLEYVQMHVSAHVSYQCFEVYATNYVQCEYSFGNEYTSKHHYLLDPLNTEKLYLTLGDPKNIELLSEIIKQKFSGPNGLLAFEAYCLERNITYKYTYQSEE